MVWDSMAAYALISIFAWLLLTGHTTPSDIECLKAIKSSFKDPNNYLASWVFDNPTPGSICRFIGIECWHAGDNKVLNIRLPDMGLEGEFPLGISGCSSMTGLDLSNNIIHGSIPSNISNLIGWVTTLDLSSNHFSGEIPADLANCSYLNVLKLNNNRLTGQIPPRIALLTRLKTFSVRRNRLTGPIPSFRNSSFPAESYAGNAGLCGKPLPPCHGASVKTHTTAVVG